MSKQEGFAVTLKLLENYVFQADFGEFGRIITDEDPPLGDGEGPTPVHMLATGILNCLSASLLFSLRKYKGDPGEITAKITGKSSRVDGRLRIESMNAEIHLANDEAELPSLEKALSQFENFCTVTQSVRHGIQVNTTVYSKDGKVLHQAN
jgi:uncharacterized OsmC-like protein